MRAPRLPVNAAIKRASGEYIFFLDSDDLFVPDKIYRQIEFHHDNKDISMSFTDYTLFNEQGEKIR